MRGMVFIVLFVASASYSTTQQDMLSNSVDTVLKVENTSTTGSKYAIAAKTTGNSTTVIYGTATGNSANVIFGNAFGTNSAGLRGGATTASSQAMYGYNPVGISVWGFSRDSVGVYGTSTYGTGISGVSSANVGIGVKGVSTASGHYSTWGYGVWGEGREAGVHGYTADGQYGVQGNAPSGVGVTGSGYHGVVGSAGFNSSGVGVSGNSYGEEGVGVRAYAHGLDGIGVHSIANGDATLAGYFDGDVVVTGACDPCSPSDAMFKKNVSRLDGGLAKVMALRPKSYEMKRDEFRDRISLPKGKRYGLIAQEVEVVLPDIVHDVSVPAALTREERDKKTVKSRVEFKAVNYDELVPVLIAAIQELKAEVDALKAGR